MINVSLSFDDGRHDNYVIAKEILESLNIPATFNITIGYILKDENIEVPSEHEPMSLDELQDLAKNSLFEIAGHGYQHNNDIDNLIYGVKKIREILNFSKDKSIGLVSPHSEFIIKDIDNFLPIFKANNISYLRVGAKFDSLNLIRKILRKLNRIFHIPFLTYWIYKNSYVNDNFPLYSIGIYKYNSFKEIKYIIDKSIKNNKSIIFELHSILKKGSPFYDDLYMWDYTKFSKLCNYLKKLEQENKIIICKTEEVKSR